MICLFFLLLFLSRKEALVADELTFDPPLPWETSCEPGCFNPCLYVENCGDDPIIIDLKEPIYEKGVLYTNKGGRLSSSQLRMQARIITFNRSEGQNNITCEGDLLVDYRGQVLIGSCFYYDFNTQSGYLLSGVTAFFPWQLGAETIVFQEDGSLEFFNGYITSSEGNAHDLVLFAPHMRIDQERRLTSSPMRLTLYEQPLVPLPSVQMDLSAMKRPTFQFKVGWGGYLGPHVSLRYHILSYYDFKASLRVDGFIHHGVGVGVDTSLDPACSFLKFYTSNYWAHDLAIDDPTKRDRYRFQGSYYNRFWDNKTSVQALYDYVSDAQMAAEYNHDSFALNPAQATELVINHRESSFLANAFVNVRVNSFQTVDQQLPAFEVNFHPIRLPFTPFIFENYFKFSNVNFITSHDLINRTTDQTARLDIRPALYWPIHFSALSLTPGARFIGIGYSNSPEHHTVNQILGELSLEATTSLHHCYSWGRHTVRPFVRYRHLTTPSSSFDQHFIFTMQDAYTRFDKLRFGVQNLFFFPFSCYPLEINLWANGFFHPHNHISTIPKGYLHSEWQLSCGFFWQMDLVMHYERNLTDLFNNRIHWALSENAALSLEYRHRSPYSWRKGNFYDFILDVSREEELLLISTLSDRRNTLLATLFYRIHPDWTVKFTSRYGLHHKQMRPYFEYEIESSTTLIDHWWFHFSYQKRESDHRFSMAIKLANKDL